ncbi:hypothetical protein F5Y01DRAFT_92576 [Xylaria sp. FL0043]|nr:hypothetical protein F5Y01DRAFT_92576 [Xylaria sp. FL0043]
MSTSSAPPYLQSRPGFLELSPGIRELIYLYVGVITDATVPLDGANTEYRRPRTLDLKGPDLDWAPTLALLRTCRLVYAEVSSLIYSANRFVTHDLRPLRNLSPSSLSSLTSLKIQIHCAPDRCLHHGHCNLLYLGYSGKPLDNSSPHDAEILDEWAATASHVGASIKESSLELSVICDVEDGKTADLVVAPLRRWPLLARCSIRLNSERNDFLHELACSSARALMGVSDALPSTFHQYLQLPVELRLKVLQYTDLVTPWTHVTWRHQKGFGVETPKCCRAGIFHMRFVKVYTPGAPEPGKNDGLSNWICSDKEYRPFGHSWDWNHYACQFRPCQRETVWYSGTGCFCSAYHAAYTPSCNCWRSPRSLFMVSKQFSEEAWFVFLSSNHFEFLGHGSSRPRDIRPISNFLVGMVSANKFQHVKSLKLDLQDTSFASPHTPSSMTPEITPQKEWRSAATLISSTSNLRYLDIDTEGVQHDAALAEWRNLKAEEIISIVRQAVNVHLWPLDTVGPAQGVQQLRVHVGYSRTSQENVDIWYNIRPQHHPAPQDEAHLKWGWNHLSFCRSIAVQGDDGAISHWTEQVLIAGEPDPYEGHYPEWVDIVPR